MEVDFPGPEGGMDPAQNQHQECMDYEGDKDDAGKLPDGILRHRIAAEPRGADEAREKDKPRKEKDKEYDCCPRKGHGEARGLPRADRLPLDLGRLLLTRGRSEDLHQCVELDLTFGTPLLRLTQSVFEVLAAACKLYEVIENKS